MVGSAIVDVGADEEPMAPLAVTSGVGVGIGVVTDGAVFAGVVGIVVVSCFLPQAPRASNAESATTVVAVRALNDIVCMKVS